MKHELLSPAGDMESLYQAIHHGADAVYLGMKNYGARSFAKNFSHEEIVEAIKICHLYGVRIYVTMNTLVKDCEVSAFLKQVSFLVQHGVDAIIMQDFGMINLVRRMYPSLEIHASTQANNSSMETIKLFYELGVKRVVLSRELSLAEIQSIDVPIELEVFIHGALCISYSGNCLMSSMIGTRSGNRGECAGSCRMIYDLYKNHNLIDKNHYLLSTRELNTSTKFKELLESNIKSFKIEGRMKSPEYVGFITGFYRKLMDGEEFNFLEEVEKLKTLYHRKYTKGHLFKDSHLMNIKTPNHIGLEIGKVIDITKNKIKIKLFKPLNQEDGIRFLESGKGCIVNFLYDDKKKLTSSVRDIAYIDNKVNLSTKDTVYKTLDSKLNHSLRNYPQKKIPIWIKVIAIKEKSIKVIFSDHLNKIEVEGNIVKDAITSSVSQEQIKKQVTKLGNTPFQCSCFEIQLSSNVFIPVSELNALRRSCVEKLIQIRSNRKIDVVKKDVYFSKLAIKNHSFKTCSVYTKEQLDTVLKLDFQRIYVHDLDLYHHYQDSRLYYFQDRNKYIMDTNLDHYLISEYFKFNHHIGNYSLNVTNIYTGYYLLFYGLSNIPLSVELTQEEINYFYASFIEKFHFHPPIEILVYGRAENMVIKGNILNLEKGLFSYYLKDKKQRIFPVYYDGYLTHLLHSEIFFYQDKFSFPYIKRFDFYEENKEDILKVVNQYK